MGTPSETGIPSETEPEEPKKSASRGGIRDRRLAALLKRQVTHCPPEGDSDGVSGGAAVAEANPAAIAEIKTSTFTFKGPRGWTLIEPEVSGTLVGAYRAADETATANAFYRPISEFLTGEDLPLDLGETLLDRLTSQELGEGTLVERVTHSAWTEISGFPAIVARADLRSGHEAHLFAVLTADRQYVLTVIVPPGRFDLAEEVARTVVIEGDRLPEVGGPQKRTKKKGSDLTKGQLSARSKEIDELPGQNFGIRPEGYQDRIVALLDQFGMFEEAEKLKLTDAQISDMSALDDAASPRNKALRQADARGADLLMVSRLRRNKVSYAGISSFGSYVADAGLTFLFWFPNFAPGFRSENYRTDVELVVEIYDVRSGAQVWTYTYRRQRTKALKATERGWLGGFGILLMRFFRTDGQIDNARTYVRPQTWLEVEHDLLLDLWSPAAFKGEIDDSGFEEKINASVVARRTAMVAGVSRYGAKAQRVLTKLARDGAVAALARTPAVRDRLKKTYGERSDNELLLANLRDSYGEPTLDFGIRPYAESDAKDIEEFLVNDGGFNRGFVKVLSGPAANRIQLKAAIRWLAKARRVDPVFSYLNLETLVVDDPTQPGDKLKKYLLPYDADLETLEVIMKENEGQERTQKVLEHLERTAISFQWIEKTLNVEGSSRDDHRHLQSREVFLVLDCAFPGHYTGLRYAPSHAGDVAEGWNPAAGPAPGAIGGGRIIEITPPEKTPGETPDKTPGETPDKTPGETPDKTPGEIPDKTPGETPDNTPGGTPDNTPGGTPDNTPGGTPDKTPGGEAEQVDPPEPEWGPRNPFGPRPPSKRRIVPEGPSGPRPSDRRRMISRSRIAPTTVLAQAPKGDKADDDKADDDKADNGKGRGRAPQLTDQFIRRLSRVPGRTIVVTGRFNDSLLDVIPQKRGAFAHHFLKGGNLRNRRVETNKERRPGWEILELRPLLEYIRTRVEDESRLLNRPQSILIYGDNDDFPLIERQKN